MKVESTRLLFVLVVCLITRVTNVDGASKSKIEVLYLEDNILFNMYI
jgi:hypothetical protein